MFIVSLILYFLSGLFLDVLVTLYYLAVASGRKFMACWTTFMLTAGGMLIFDHFIDNQSIWLIVSYSLGNVAGTYIGMFYQPKKK